LLSLDFVDVDVTGDLRLFVDPLEFNGSRVLKF